MTNAATQEWQYEKPKDGKTHIKKKINGKQVDYWWCEPLEMWARHKPENCKAEDKKGQRQLSEGQEQGQGRCTTSGSTDNNLHHGGRG